MNRDPRFALSQELEAKPSLLDQLRALAADDPDFFTDLIERETNLLELIAALDASIVDDEILVDGAKPALDKYAHGQWFPIAGVARWDESSISATARSTYEIERLSSSRDSAGNKVPSSGRARCDEIRRPLGRSDHRFARGDISRW